MMSEIVRKLTMAEIEARSQNRERPGRGSLTLVCDHIRSALNVGSMFRTADALGVRQIVLVGYTACPPHREILKTALGATETVPWQHVPDIPTAIHDLRASGHTLVGLEQTTSSLPLTAWQKPELPVALFVGNEVSGLSDALLPSLDHILEIPQVGTKHSLNVAVAAGIAIWEILGR